MYKVKHRALKWLIEKTKMIENILSGNKTGFYPFDYTTGGLDPGKLIVISSDLPAGKTSFAANVALNVNTPVAVYPLLEKTLFASCIIASNNNISFGESFPAATPGRMLTDIGNGLTAIKDKPIYFDDTAGTDIDRILSSIRMMKERFNISGVIVGCIQQLKTSDHPGIVSALKSLAIELDIWIISLCDSKRVKGDPVPDLSKLVDRKEVEEAADMVILIYRPQLHRVDYPKPFENVSTHETALIDVAVNRGGEPFKFICRYIHKNISFADLREIPVKTEFQL